MLESQPQHFNDFNLDLKYSLDLRDDSMFDTFYHHIFPELVNIEFVKDLTQQKLGIDKIMTFSNGKIMTLDEKKRRTDYGDDILLEIWSAWEYRKPGWLITSHSDYIVYAVIPSKRLYLLPTVLLQATWDQHKEEWLKTYWRWIIGRNKYYTTKNKAIPSAILLEAIKNTMAQTITTLGISK